MTTLIINKGKNKAKVWIQDLLIGGIITDENGNDTVVSKMFSEENNLEDFFNRVTEKTGIDFFPQKQQSKISA